MNILFMCVANSARSQLAEGLAKQLFPMADIRSAGSNPGKLNSFAVAAMNEIGVDISRQYSKSIEELPSEYIENLDYVITLCAEEVCPILLTKKAVKLHWPLKDPAAKENLSDEVMLSRFRETREAISSNLSSFKAKLKL